MLNVVLFKKLPESQQELPPKVCSADFVKVLKAIDPEINLKEDDMTDLYRIPARFEDIYLIFR